jgi:hypothetical protein
MSSQPLIWYRPPQFVYDFHRQQVLVEIRLLPLCFSLRKRESRRVGAGYRAKNVNCPSKVPLNGRAITDLFQVGRLIFD